MKPPVHYNPLPRFGLQSATRFAYYAHRVQGPHPLVVLLHAGGWTPTKVDDRRMDFSYDNRRWQELLREFQERRCPVSLNGGVPHPDDEEMAKWLTP